jgi:hypothetical protein
MSHHYLRAGDFCDFVLSITIQKKNTANKKTTTTRTNLLWTHRTQPKQSQSDFNVLSFVLFNEKYYTHS